MKSFSNFQFFPIDNDSVFEEFVCDIFNSVDKTSSYELFGRKGQNQYGIDIYSFDKATVIQCKHKLIIRADQKVKEELLEDFKNEITRFESFNEDTSNHFKRFIVASTFKNDTSLAAECIKLSAQHNIKLEYWSWKRLTNHVSAEIFEKYYDFFKKSAEAYYLNSANINSLIPLDKNLPLLNQLYEFLSIRFRDIKILHSRMFLNENVFERKLNDYSRRIVFTYKSYNEGFFDMFETLEFKDNTLINNFGKDSLQFQMYDFITKTLSENGISRVLGKKYGQLKTITNREKKPDDYFDHFEKFKFLDLFKALPESAETDTLDEILKQGYFYYKIGDLLRSKDLFHIASIKAVEQDRKISHLIAQHNLLHLGTFIEWGYYMLPDKSEIIKDLKDISLQGIEVDAIDLKIKEIIVSRSFFYSAKESIQSYTSKVEEMYYSYLRGGSSSVNFEDELDYEYSVLHSFLSKNYIVYDQYSDYSHVINSLFKSLMASYSIKSGRNKIEYLNDYYLYHFVEYGDRKEFEKYLKRYKIYEIQYEKLDDEDYHFVNLFLNFSNSSTPELNVLLEQNDKYLVENFKERFNKIFRNFVFFSGLLKLENIEVSQITNAIFKILSNDKILEKYNTDSVYDFFIRKSTQIEKSLMQKFIFYILSNEGYYDSRKLINFFNELKYHKIILDFNETEFIFLMKSIAEKSEIRSDYHFAVTLYQVLGREQQQILKSKLLENLKSEFDRDLFSMMVIYDLIDYNFDGYFDSFLASIDLEKERSSNTNRRMDDSLESKRYSVLDDLFNIVFKFNHDLQDKRFEGFKGISDYYDWLLDIDHFDYSKFDPYWIDDYSTKYYYAYMKKHEAVLKKEVLLHIAKTQDERLRKICYNIFCFEE